MLNLSRQFAQIREEVLEAIAAVCDSQQLILGPAVESFERNAAAFCSVAYGIGCASGTDALWLTMAAAGMGPGDAVVTTPFSFFATVSAILRAGVRPVLADIDPLTCNLSPASVNHVCNRLAADAHAPTGEALRLRALLPVHLYGQCADVDALGEIARTHHLLLLEDAAQAIGARWNGVSAGALGDAAAFSFYPTKNLSALGDAGLVTSPDEVLAERARMLRAHGMRRRYVHDEVGWNSRLDAVQAAVLDVKLRYLPGWTARRQALAARYDQLFTERDLAIPYAEFAETVQQPIPPTTPSRGSGHPAERRIVLPFTDPRATHVFHQYVIRVRDRDALRAHLAGKGIGSEVYYPRPLHLQTALQQLGYRAGDFPESERAANEVLALPIYPELLEEEQDRVVEGIASFLCR